MLKSNELLLLYRARGSTCPILSDHSHSYAIMLVLCRFQCIYYRSSFPPFQVQSYFCNRQYFGVQKTKNGDRGTIMYSAALKTHRPANGKVSNLVRCPIIERSISKCVRILRERARHIVVVSTQSIWSLSTQGHQRHGQRDCWQQDIHTWRGHRKRAQAAAGGCSQTSTTPTAGEQQQRWQPPQHVCMYVCMVITYSRVWINRVRLPILLVVS